MRLKFVAVADLHGELPDIPECDVLLIAGDICPDFSRLRTGGDPNIMGIMQRQWLRDEYADWEEHVPATHILATPGNHDWIAAFPVSCRSLMFIDEGTTINGVSFWFTPWIVPVADWNYELPRDQRKDRFAEIPQHLDVLVSHSPAYDVGDVTYSNIKAGCPELRAAIYDKKPKHHVFGHIHEGQRYGKTYQLGATTVHHASQWGDGWSPTMFEVDGEKG